MRIFSTLLLICGLALSGPALALLQSPAPQGGLVLMIGPPSVDFNQLARQYGGHLVGPEQAPFGAFAQFDQHTETLARDLRESGLWLMLDGTRLAQICGVSV